jgi:glycosyltransferase involved in cell wall biosynthesis
MTGIDAALQHGADVIVNTDADNQYEASDIPQLVRPILEHRADMVIGARPIAQTEHFSWIKKKLQHLGSWAVRIASRTDVTDAPSGFRAMTRETAMRLKVFNAYTYTLETIIQAGLSNLSVVSVPIRTNPDLRPSRLVKSIPNYVKRSLVTILRVFVIYRPLTLFMWTSVILISVGLAVSARYLAFLAAGNGSGHVQSLILAALCIMLGALSFMIGVIADLIATNRKLLEQVDVRLQQITLGAAAARQLRPGDSPPKRQA